MSVCRGVGERSLGHAGSPPRWASTCSRPGPSTPCWARSRRRVVSPKRAARAVCAQSPKHPGSIGPAPPSAGGAEGSRAQNRPTSATETHRGSAAGQSAASVHPREHNDPPWPSTHKALAQSSPDVHAVCPATPVPRAPGAQAQPAASEHTQRSDGTQSSLKLHAPPGEPTSAGGVSATTASAITASVAASPGVAGAASVHPERAAAQRRTRLEKVKRVDMVRVGVARRRACEAAGIVHPPAPRCRRRVARRGTMGVCSRGITPQTP